MTEVGECSGGVADIDGLVTSINSQLKYYCSHFKVHPGQFSLIYRVQDNLRRIDRNAYQPIIVSIGPYHHGSADLSSMERKKWDCVDFVVKSNCGKGLQDYLNVLKGKEDLAKQCYSEEIKMEEPDFLRMLLLDGCFVLVTLGGMNGIVPSSFTRDQESIEMVSDKPVGVLSGNKNKGSANGSQQEIINESTEPIEHEKYQDESQRFGPWYNNFISHDLLLLENQIPFFIVKEIYDMLTGGSNGTMSLTNNIAEYVENFVPIYSRAIQESCRPKSFHHLLHLCHMYFRPTHSHEKDQDEVKPKHFGILHFGLRHLKFGNRLEEDQYSTFLNQQRTCNKACHQLMHWRRVSQYYETGIKFKKKPLNKQRPHSQLDITFHNGIVEIPCLSVDQNTNSLFRNLIAFEQKCPQFGNDFTAYIAFMSHLMSMPEDVTVLAKRGIIIHEMRTDEEVSTLFAKLVKNVDFDLNSGCYLTYMCLAMEEHYQKRFNRWMAWLWQNHFKNPWLMLAVAAAIIVVLCTLLQSLFALLAYVNEK